MPVRWLPQVDRGLWVQWLVSRNLGIPSASYTLEIYDRSLLQLRLIS